MKIFAKSFAYLPKRATSLVKKDQDLSKLRFVSFRVEVNDEEFDTLYDAGLWSNFEKHHRSKILQEQKRVR